jgi:hypothetical protein
VSAVLHKNPIKMAFPRMLVTITTTMAMMMMTVMSISNEFLLFIHKIINASRRYEKGDFSLFVVVVFAVSSSLKKVRN